ncbi:beta-ketoacyl-ACP synthase I [Rhodovulum sulfidophilum]|uniref:beta-ketoacyl-ACP synthase I n=1 Tax=Rhodovulum sulfidophilum TaxID=35806 RepID=UPI0019243278|nr:beta-ketoacyl-ACP synthase I [Rhodovulum sulfidophilum]MBL3573231.1 beta-ketoacyl-ACP synthase I [Rhodovulum sulfidophilum]MCE8419997.1 beta-ketoacyl-ACP synthase I [Rhodovulum sulfidophilum]MCE8430882.1 beta-ketoacyl-ACP synthase I [Rhodovulum sulfidophilum]MCF4115855.1 beta-ketoacyl-ACP synthase I [Rhodovulum sulfidophilum]
MRRVVITGMGIISPIGNSTAEVEASLRAGRSGIRFEPVYAENGFRSQVAGIPQIDLEGSIDKRQLRFMGAGAAYNYLAMEQAIADAGLEAGEVSNPRTGLIVGSGGPSTANFFVAHSTVKEKGSPKRMGPFMVTRCMSSTNSACLATPFRIKGVNYSITSACSTSAHCIGNAAELIQMGKQDVIFAGGGEEVDWTLSCLFDAMNAMSSKYNDTPETASRPFDATRDGFVIAGGGGVVVLEELEHAKARGATIYAEVTGYGATSDGYDMVAPSGEGGERSMELALATLPEGRRVDYINAHGTSTVAGDVTEVKGVRNVFGEDAMPPIASTKSLTGHSLGATGVHEAIYSLIMMRKGFIAASANVTELDPEIRPGEIATELREGVEIDSVLSNSFGFGGTNATLLMSKYHG